MRWSNWGRGTGGSSACQVPWKQSVVEELLAGWVQCTHNPSYLSLLNNRAAVNLSHHSSSQEPVLSKEQPAFQYSSHVSLQAPSGHMWCVWLLIHIPFSVACVGALSLQRWSHFMFVFRGTFRIERTDGSHFDVRIPPFSLESNKDDKAPPAGYTF